MTLYEPHCDCLGGHVVMRPDPNGRWCRADDPRAVADDPSAERQDALTYVDVDVSCGNGETYPVRVTSLSADQARRMFGWDPTDPPPVADDPSGIVQQMPEGSLMSDEEWPAKLRLSDHYADEIIGYMQVDDRVSGGMAYVRADTANATEADLRAEIERLTLRLDDWQGRAAMAGCALAAVLAGKPVRNADEIISFCRTATLSPETDGGHDA